MNSQATKSAESLRAGFLGAGVSFKYTAVSIRYHRQTIEQKARQLTPASLTAPLPPTVNGMGVDAVN